MKTARYRKTLSETSQRQLNLYALVASLLAGLLLFGLLPSNASAATKYQVLYSFQGGGGDGAYPVGALTFDTTGSLMDQPISAVTMMVTGAIAAVRRDAARFSGSPPVEVDGRRARSIYSALRIIARTAPSLMAT